MTKSGNKAADMINKINVCGFSYVKSMTEQSPNKAMSP